MSQLTAPRQVRLLKCALLTPGLSARGTGDDVSLLQDYGFNIMPYIQRIDVFEGIFDNTISGSITLLENIGLVEYLPIVGVETLIVSFSVDGEDGTVKTFQRAFRITKVHKGTYPKHEWRLFTMEFVTNEFVTSMSRRICRPFTGVTCQRAVEDILKKDFGVDPSKMVTNEPTYDVISVLVPNYSPLKAINFFTALAQTKDTKESNFLFFETLEGFHFTSIKKLIESAPAKLRTFEVNPGMMSSGDIDDARMRNSLTRVDQDVCFDLLSDIAVGTLRAQMVHFDILARKQEHVTDSRYTETFKATTHLDKYPVYPENFDKSIGENVRLFTVPSNAWSTKSAYVQSKDGKGVEQRLRESIILRNRQLQEIRHIQTLLDVAGAPDLRAGSIVNVNYPPTRILANKETSITDVVPAQPTPYYSGRHLVMSVHHILATHQDSMVYRMNLRVCRDSLGAPLMKFK
jgi:hypothetical protein